MKGQIKKAVHKVKSLVSEFEVGVLNRRAKHYGYNLIKEKPSECSEVVIENYFKTSYSKNALLSYVIYPFTGEIQNHHSNNRECYLMGQILNELGFNVDVINWNNTTFLPVKKYNVVIDNHNNLARLRSFFSYNTTRVFHATNTFWVYQNMIEYIRCYNFFLNKGTAVKPTRLISEGNSAAHCDVITMFGNEFTKSTYGAYSSKVYQLPVSVTAVPRKIERDYSLAKKKFIWLNSHGALLKGLDIVIEAFAMLPHLCLYICADADQDKEFKEVFNEQLSASPNITMVGWVDINEEFFEKMASECAWVVSTSFSEGGGGSTLNCMAKGLIPVISKSASISLPENTGFYVNENTTCELITLLKAISLLPATELLERSHNSLHFISLNHTINNFKSAYKKFLNDILR